MSNDIQQEKQHVREHYRQLRNAVSEEDAYIAGQQVLIPLFDPKLMNLLVRYRAFASFVNIPSEISTELIGRTIISAGATLCVPKWDPALNRYIFSKITPQMPMVLGRHQIWEPQERIHFPSSDIEATIVPGIAFDTFGNRIGYGEGNYDQLISRLRPSAIKIGLCYDCQLSQDTLPHEAHDHRVDYVITDKRFVDCRKNLRLSRATPTCQIPHKNPFIK